MLASNCFAGLSGSSDGVLVRALAAGRTRRRRRGARHAASGRISRAIESAMAAELEPLERRQLMSVSINGSFTLDESAGLQTSGVAVPGEDNNDNDVAVGTLPATFSSRLFGAPSGGLGLSN